MSRMESSCWNYYAPAGFRWFDEGNLQIGKQQANFARVLPSLNLGLRFHLRTTGIGLQEPSDDKSDTIQELVELQVAQEQDLIAVPIATENVQVG